MHEKGRTTEPLGELRSKSRRGRKYAQSRAPSLVHAEFVDKLQHVERAYPIKRTIVMASGEDKFNLHVVSITFSVGTCWDFGKGSLVQVRVLQLHPW